MREYGKRRIVRPLLYSDDTPDVALEDLDRLGRPRTVKQAGVIMEKLTYHPGSAALKARYNASSHPLLPGLGIRYSAPDAAGRPAGFMETSGSDAAVERTVGYGYDPSGRMETITDGGLSHTYAYYPNSSLISTIHSYSGTTAWFRESRDYETSGRLGGISSDRMNGTSVVAAISNHTYVHDDLGRREKNTLQDGSFWQYGYNDRSEVTSATRKTSGGTAIPALGASYDYDGIGNRLTSTSPVMGDHIYTPNSLNQYSSITTGSSRTAVGRAPAGWTVQVAGTNATRVGEIYHRDLTAANSAAPVWQSVITRRDTGAPSMTSHFWYAKTPTVPTYDVDGNLTNDGRWVYSWNAENRLIQMETTPQATAAGHPYTKLKFVYDREGHRIARTVWQGGTAGNPTFKSNHRWLYDGRNVIAEFSGTVESGGTLTRLNTYTWGLDLSGTLQGAGGIGGLLCVSLNSQPSTLNYSPSYDGNGNIVAWTKSTASAPTSRREYDAFGNTLVSEGTWPCSFGFSTKMQDAETGLYYYGYRYYDPVHGRWLNKDPIGEKGGVNLYGIVENRALNEVDVLGQSGWEVSDKDRCCTDPVVQIGKDELRERYKKLMKGMAERGLRPKGAGKGKSCKERASAVMAVLSPIPKCWDCMEKRGFQGPITLIEHDHVWVECKSNPIDGQVEVLAFDAWSGYDDAVSPHIPNNDFPYEGEVEGPTVVQESDCNIEFDYNDSTGGIIDTQQ